MIARKTPQPRQAAIAPTDRTLYHGTNTEESIDRLKPNERGILWLGERDTAGRYALTHYRGGEPRVFEVTLKPGAKIVDLRDPRNRVSQAVKDNLEHSLVGWYGIGYTMTDEEYTKRADFGLLEGYPWVVKLLRRKGVDAAIVNDNFSGVAGAGGTHESLAVINMRIVEGSAEELAVSKAASAQRWYHGTPAKNLQAVLESGVLKPGSESNYGISAAPNPKAVYVTTDLVIAGEYAEDGEVLEVRVDENRLIPDEDSIGELLLDGSLGENDHYFGRVLELWFDRVSDMNPAYKRRARKALDALATDPMRSPIWARQVKRLAEIIAKEHPELARQIIHDSGKAAHIGEVPVIGVAGVLDGREIPMTASATLIAAEEATERAYAYGCVLTNVEPGTQVEDSILDLLSRIDIDDFAGKGMEESAHITVRFGLIGGDIGGLVSYLKTVAPFEVEFGPVDTFEPSKSSGGAAVVMVTVISPELLKMNAALAQHAEFKKADFEYHPHLTLAYVKPEAAEKYKGMELDRSVKLLVDRIQVRDQDGTETEVELMA